MKHLHPLRFSLLVFLLTLPFALFAEAEGSKTKIGVILPLSGGLAEYGVAAKNGFILAQERHPELFSSLQFLFEDDQYDSKKSLAAYQKFITSDDVAALYVWGYGPNQALAPLAETQGIPLFAISGERSISKDRKFVVRFCYHIQMIADALLSYVRSKGFKRVGILKTELAYMNGLLSKMQASLREDERLEVVDSFELGDTDFKSSIAKLRTNTYDALGVLLVGPQVSQFYRQSKQLALKLPSIGTDFFDSRDLVKSAHGTMDGAVFAAPAFNPSFEDSYKKRFGNDVQLAWAANSYEFALLAGRVFSHTAPKKTGLIAAFRQALTAQGEATTFRFEDSPEGSGFESGVTLRKVHVDEIIQASAP